jgi:hypothetical protein
MSTITIDRATLEQALEALDLAQSLLEKSRHHSKIIEAYTVIRQAVATDDVVQKIISKLEHAVATDDVVQKIISKLEPLLDAKNQSWAEADRMLHGIAKGGAA